MKSFIEELLESFINDLDKSIDELAPKNWCIGSGSEFVIYENIEYSKAIKIFENLDIRQCCGRLIEEKETTYFKIQTYHTMESNTGKTRLFIFPVKKGEKQ